MNTDRSDEDRPFEEHADYEHVGMTKAQIRFGAIIVGGLLIFSVISGMFLY